MEFCEQKVLKALSMKNVRGYITVTKGNERDKTTRGWVEATVVGGQGTCLLGAKQGGAGPKRGAKELIARNQTKRTCSKEARGVSPS